jgi:hypothetical protein
MSSVVFTALPGDGRNGKLDGPEERHKTEKENGY